ncbi:MAG: aminotransferase class I/II-fold pyridoxal phosphate-dependent enzyme, partial [Kangiellaceae bacterium]|nr:aminotransferase class I/II-fold pyridoxal phosphate-dependent enzyme [Kangiellaceae bacterium]
STPFQAGIAEMLKTMPQHVHELKSFYQTKRDTLIDALLESRFNVLPCYGTYFLLVDYSEISSLDDMDFCIWMAKEIGVVAIPLSPFCETPDSAKVVRLCFAKHESTLIEAGKRMGQL